MGMFWGQLGASLRSSWGYSGRLLSVFSKDFLQLRRTCALSTYASKQEDGEEEVLRLVLSDERTLHLVLTV